MSDTAEFHCQACRTIDLADGVEDGCLYPVIATRVGDERVLSLRALRRAEARVADRITAFSGSMAFVYIHMSYNPKLWIESES